MIEEDPSRQHLELYRLVIRIDQDWTVQQFADELYSLNAMYDVLFRVEYGMTHEEARQSPFFPSLWELGVSDYHLRVRKLRYSSPGFQDLTGLGKVVEQIRLILEYTIGQVTSYEYNRRAVEEKAEQVRRVAIENEMLREDLLAKKIENTERFLLLCQKYDVPRETRDELLPVFVRANRVMEDAAVSGRITGVETIKVSRSRR